MSAMLTTLPVLFVLQNHMLVKGIQNYMKDEQRGKMSFVRLIGRHDAVFLFVIYGLFNSVSTIIDALSRDFRFGVNLWYLIYALYAFAKLMDHKQSSSKWLRILSFGTIVAYISIYVFFTLRFHKNPFPEREFPLYKPIIEQNSTNLTNSTILNSTLEEVSQNITEIINQNGTSTLIEEL